MNNIYIVNKDNIKLKRALERYSKILKESKSDKLKNNSKEKISI